MDKVWKQVCSSILPSEELPLPSVFPPPSPCPAVPGLLLSSGLVSPTGALLEQPCWTHKPEAESAAWTAGQEGCGSPPGAICCFWGVGNQHIN